MQARKRMARWVGELFVGMLPVAGVVVLPPAAVQAAPPHVAPGVSHPAAMTAQAARVHLAWLADPMTFPSQLGAQMTSTGLVVQGYVPTVGVHERALQIAQANFGGPLIDQIRVQSGLSLRFVNPRPTAELQAAAEKLVRSTLGEGTKVRVQAQDNGIVAFSGFVGSTEEQCRLAQGFRGLDGCRAVVTHPDVGTGTQVASTARPTPTPKLAPPPLVPTRVAAKPPSPPPAPLPVVVTGAPTPFSTTASRPEMLTRGPKPLSLGTLPPPPPDGLHVVSNGPKASPVTPPPPPAPVAKPVAAAPEPRKEQVIVLASFSKPAGTEGKVTDNRPGVTTGLVTLESPGTEQVRKAIEAACGTAAGGVRVNVKGRRELCISLTVNRKEEWPALRKRLAALPELAVFAVSFEAR